MPPPPPSSRGTTPFAPLADFMRAPTATTATTEGDALPPYLPRSHDAQVAIDDVAIFFRLLR